MPKPSETEIAAPIVTWFQDEYEAEVYQEVKHGTGIIDIVAVLPGSPRRIWIVETKTSLSLHVLDQAFDRIPYSHYVSVGVPTSHLSRPPFTQRILYDYGIGLFTVDLSNSWKKVRCEIDPGLNRSVRSDLKGIKALEKKLCEEQKVCCSAGSAGGGYWTTFKGTARRVQEIVAANPGIDLKELLSNHGKFHYHTSRSAKTSLVERIRRGIVGDVRIFQDGKRTRLYLKGDPIFGEKSPLERELEEAFQC